MHVNGVSATPFTCIGKFSQQIFALPRIAALEIHWILFCCVNMALKVPLHEVHSLFNFLLSL